MSMTDDNNPECECSHLWSNHYNKTNMYFCEAPEFLCESFSEQTVWDRVANTIIQLEEEMVEEEALDYDCERHGKGRGPDCPTCFMDDEKIKGRYIP